MRGAALFLRVLALATLAPLVARVRPSRLEAVLEPRRPARAGTPAEIDDIVTAVDVAMRVGRPLVRPGCLTRGITLYRTLRSAGVDVTLCFGVGKPEEGFMGHCWLTKGGVPFLEARDPRPLYRETYRIPHREPA